MDAVKEAQIEQRLDDLSRQFDRAEERNHGEHREIRAEIRGVREETNTLRAEMNAGFGAIRASMDGFNRTLIFSLWSLVAGIVASVAAAVASQLF